MAKYLLVLICWLLTSAHVFAYQRQVENFVRSCDNGGLCISRSNLVLYRKIFNNIEKAISDNYFKNNLLALTPKRRNLETDSQVINQLILELRKNPQISIAEMVEKHRLQLVYPIFILCNYDINYDTTISSMINHIKEKYSGKNLNIGIDYNLFFILLPVSNVAQIKSQVLQWIKSKQSLSLL